MEVFLAQWFHVLHPSFSPEAVGSKPNNTIYDFHDFIDFLLSLLLVFWVCFWIVKLESYIEKEPGMGLILSQLILSV